MEPISALAAVLISKASQPVAVRVGPGSGSVSLLEDSGDPVDDVRVEPVGQPVRFELIEAGPQLGYDDWPGSTGGIV